MAGQVGHVHETLDSLCGWGGPRGAVIFRHHASLCGSASQSRVWSFLFSQSSVGSHDPFIDAETWSVCKSEAGTGGLAPFSGHPGLRSKTHFQANLGYLCPQQTSRKMSRIERRKGKEDTAEGGVEGGGKRGRKEQVEKKENREGKEE